MRHYLVTGSNLSTASRRETFFCATFVMGDPYEIRDTICITGSIRKIGGRKADMLRYTGESCVLIRIDNTAVLAEKSVINLRMPYIFGEVKMLCISAAVCDVIVEKFKRSKKL
ncbi:hypothetical protein PoB_003951700 [Plakobranchus ocellatus]|uniref:Uncharacterized protein n=1 Tax=Plakobranchus ocellatus TaxID=259542 RepID=A0AAV4B0I0_9GAST|nr:hypothetical protein PoB_003951700 [Plakobranchus ocellatus]